MNHVLWLSAETPSRHGGGGRRRQFHQISALITEGIDVAVTTLAGDQDDRTIGALAPTHRFPAHRRLRRNRALEQIVATVAPKGAIVAHIESVPFVVPTLRRAGVPFLLDFHNVNSRWHHALEDDREAARWREQEREALLLAAHATACSGEERDALLALETATAITVAPQGIDPSEWPVEALRVPREPCVALFGSWTHSPNRIAAEWFGREVWPHVHAAVPESRWLLFGHSEPPPTLLDLPGVESRGTVDSLAHALAAVRVAVVPIQQGIGSRVKFVESLASGAAVVSTGTGCEGFAADGAFVRADAPSEFASACVRLLRDEGAAAELGSAGRKLAFDHYTWAETTAPLAAFARGVTG